MDAAGHQISAPFWLGKHDEFMRALVGKDVLVEGRGEITDYAVFPDYKIFVCKKLINQIN